MTITFESTARGALESGGSATPSFFSSVGTTDATWREFASDGDAFTYKTVLTVDHGGRPLTLPLQVEIRRTRQYTSIAEPRTGIHGVGSTLREATDDFYRALLEVRDELARQDALTPQMRALLAFTASLI